MITCQTYQPQKGQTLKFLAENLELKLQIWGFVKRSYVIIKNEMFSDLAFFNSLNTVSPVGDVWNNFF